MITTDIRTETSLILRLEKRAAATCEKLVDLCAASQSIASELQHRFLAAVSDIEHVTIEALTAEHGAFLVDEGWLKISEEAVARLLAFVLAEVRGRAVDDRRTLLPEEVPEIIERVFVDYVLHELRHRTQGVGKYATVGELKEIADRKSV